MPETQKNKPKLKYSELSKAERNILLKYGLSNENPDNLIATKGMSYIYDIERDTHLASQLGTRRNKLIKKGYRIRPGEKNGKPTAASRLMAEFVQDQLKDMTGSFLKDIEAMLNAIGQGFSLTEINYKLIRRGKWKGKVGLKSLRFKKAKNFSFKFDQYGHYTINQIDPDITGVELPSDKFIHIINGPDDENPYGDSLSAKCAFWVWLKKNGAKFWAIFNERFGMPLVVGEVPRKATPEELTKMDDIIQDIQTEAGIRIPEGFKVSFLEAMRRGDVTYDNFIERCNKEISKLILGATLISEEGKRGQGSYALGQGHVGVLEDYIVFDALVTAEAINEQLIRRLIDINYVTDIYPEFEWLGIDIPGLISLAQAVGILMDGGMEIPQSWVREKSGIPAPKEGEAVLKRVAQTNQPATQTGVDNKSNRSYEEMFSEQFAEFPPEIQQEIKEMDAIVERSVKVVADHRENMVKKLIPIIKKKSLNAAS
jgi:phage gp29-like protein